MSRSLQAKLEPARNGVYAAPRALEGLRTAAAAAGIAWCDLDLAGVVAKPQFLRCCAAALQFPDGFGHNWDALADSLEDLAWQPARGVVVHWHGGGGFAREAAEDFATALEIFTAAASYWQNRTRTMLVLLDRPSCGGHVIQALSRR